MRKFCIFLRKLCEEFKSIGLNCDCTLSAAAKLVEKVFRNKQKNSRGEIYRWKFDVKLWMRSIRLNLMIVCNNNSSTSPTSPSNQRFEFPHWKIRGKLTGKPSNCTSTWLFIPPVSSRSTSVFTRGSRCQHPTSNKSMREHIQSSLKSARDAFCAKLCNEKGKKNKEIYHQIIIKSVCSKQIRHSRGGSLAHTLNSTRDLCD